MRNSLFIGSISIFLMACGGSAVVNLPANSTNANSTAANTNITTNTTGTVNTNANKAVNAAKPAEAALKRITFAKGKFETTETVTINPGASIKFVVGAKSDQRFDLTLSSKDITAKILQGKAGEFYDMGDEKDKYYQSVVEGDGDIIFEVKNPTKKAVTTSVKVWIDLNGD